MAAEAAGTGQGNNSTPEDDGSSSGPDDGAEPMGKITQSNSGNDASDESPQPPLSKKALRKRERRERKAAQWKQERKKRRTARKKRHVVGDGEGDFGSNVLVVNEGAEMTVEQKREMREARKAVEIADFMARSEKGTTVVLDLEWEDKLSDREVKALVQQVLFCYGSNRSALRPVRLVLSGVKPGSHTLERLQKLAGFPKSWQGVTILEQRYIEHFDSDRDRHRLVYLTADTDTVVRTFEPEKVYIIGGIVDHNRLKGSTRAKADEQRIIWSSVRRAGS